LQLAAAREQKVAGGVGGGVSHPTGSSVSSRLGGAAAGGGRQLGGDRAPASWRWEKQEMERQLKDYRKKLDDIYAEMKRNQVKWKAAGEDIARVSGYLLTSSLTFPAIPRKTLFNRQLYVCVLTVLALSVLF